MTTQTATTTQTNGSEAAAEAKARSESRTAKERAEVALTAAKESVGHGLEAAREKASAIGTGIKGTANAAKQQVERVKAGAAEGYQVARKKTRKLANDGETWVKDHPTRSVVGALAIGTAAGFLASTLASRRRRRRRADAA